MPARTPAPDAVAVALDLGESDHAALCRMVHAIPSCASCNVRPCDATESYAAARAAHAAMVKALEAADKLAKQAGFWWQAASSAECITNQGLVEALTAYRAARGAQ